MITIKDFDRTNFNGSKFEFICDKNYLTIQTCPQKAIEWFISFKGVEPLEVIQVSKYPARRS